MKTVMVVDDSSIARQIVSLVLSDVGYRVVEAEDGCDALALLDRDQDVCLIISDLRMPRMDGIGFLREVKKHPTHAQTPVIVLSGESQEENERQCREAGACAWMAKPFTPEGIRETVARLLD